MMSGSEETSVKTVDELLLEAESRPQKEVETTFNETNEDYTVVFGRTWKDSL